MTVSISRPNPATNNLRVQITYGPVTAAVEEDYGHLKSVWSQLGKLIEDIEAEI